MLSPRVALDVSCQMQIARIQRAPRVRVLASSSTLIRGGAIAQERAAGTRQYGRGSSSQQRRDRLAAHYRSPEHMAMMRRRRIERLAETQYAEVVESYHVGI